MSGRIESFHPSQIPKRMWWQMEHEVRAWVAASEPPTPGRASTLMNAVTQHAAFCLDRGIELNGAVVFHPDTVEHFILEGCAKLSEGTRGNYRSQLRTVGEAVIGAAARPDRGRPIKQATPEQPYTIEEQAALLAWQKGLTTPVMRNGVAALLAFGLGAGLASQDIVALVGTDIEERADGVVISVPGPNARLVAPLRRWENRIAELAKTAGPEPVFLPGRAEIRGRHVTHFLQRLPRENTPRLNTTRLRITWIVEQLQAGTPLHVLCQGAGVGAQQFARYVSMVQPVRPEDALRLLREASPR